MKWLLLGILGSSVVAFYIINTEHAVNQQHVAPMSSEPSIETKLRAENRQLKDQVIKLSAEIASLKANTPDIKSSQAGAVSSLAPAQKKLPEPASMQAQFQEFDNFLGSGDNAFAALKTSFSDEPVDTPWANEHQRQLEKFFKKSFTDVFPQYIECRSKRCKITIPASDQKTFSELSQTIMQGIFNNEEGIAKKIIIEPATNDGTLNFYLAKNDEVGLLQ